MPSQTATRQAVKTTPCTVGHVGARTNRLVPQRPLDVSGKTRAQYDNSEINHRRLSGRAAARGPAPRCPGPFGKFRISELKHLDSHLLWREPGSPERFGKPGLAPYFTSSFHPVDLQVARAAAGEFAAAFVVFKKPRLSRPGTRNAAVGAIQGAPPAVASRRTQTTRFRFRSAMKHCRPLAHRKGTQQRIRSTPFTEDQGFFSS